MKNYTLYLIRHGITQGNLDGKYIGLTDLPLCDEGFYAITRYAHERLYPAVQKVYSSPLKRCLETADIIYPDRYVKQIDNIAECDFGEFEGKTQEELKDLPEYAEWLKGGYEAKAPGGESFGDFTLRCLDGLEEIFKDMMKDQVTKAAVITHGGVIMNVTAFSSIARISSVMSSSPSIADETSSLRFSRLRRYVSRSKSSRSCWSASAPVASIR